MWIRTGLAVWPSAVSTTSTSPVPARLRGRSTVTSSNPGKWPDAPLTAAPAIRGRADAVPTISGHRGNGRQPEYLVATPGSSRALPRQIRAEAGHRRPYAVLFPQQEHVGEGQ